MPVWVCMECRTEQPNNELQCVKCGNILPELFEEKDAYNKSIPAPKPKTMVKKTEHVEEKVKEASVPAPAEEPKADEALIPAGDLPLDEPTKGKEIPGATFTPGNNAEKPKEEKVEDKPADKPVEEKKPKVKSKKKGKKKRKPTFFN